MSVIEEALRQVQETAPPAAPAQRIPPAPPRVAGVPERGPLRPVSSRADSGMPSAVLASLALVGLVSIVWLASGWWPARRAPAAAPRSALAPASPVSTAFLRRPIARAEAPMPAFTLSGIMDQGGEKFAVVNNTIVQAGDLVDGARVLEVRSNSVWLRAKNQDVILKTSR